MKVAIIRYNAGNIQSVAFALQRLGIKPEITSDPEEIAGADKVIFPGVGEASGTIKHLKDKGFDRVITNLHQPVLGICLGLQLLCRHSEEGDTPCLGIFDETVKKFSSDFSENDNRLKIPHMGWNSLRNMRGPLMKGLGDNPYVYFVHSYFAVTGTHSMATSYYGTEFSAVLQKDNFMAVQFHPEKSGSIGEQILKNFIQL